MRVRRVIGYRFCLTEVHGGGLRTRHHDGERLQGATWMLQFSASELRFSDIETTH